MKFLLFIALTLASCNTADADKCNVPIKIVVLDTGFGYLGRGSEAHLCKYGHKDFTIDRVFVTNSKTKTPVPLDLNAHGTNIVGIIDSYLKDSGVNYCLVILKYFSEKQNGPQNLEASVRAINYAANIDADYINYSGGGYNPNLEEKLATVRYLNQGGRIIEAAMNDGLNLDFPENAVYPAMYDDRIVMIGNLGKNGVKMESSNYGSPVSRWEIGESVEAYGLTLTGTSQATAVATGKIVSGTPKVCRYR